MSQQNNSKLLTISARAPFHVYFEGEALSLSAENKVGPFDILPEHADFFSMLEPCTVHIDTEDKRLSFSVDNGMITVQNDHVLLFVNM